ncbi:TetR/AcrR family transcriptional regulator [Paenibacillus silviterrae]|uniref:TetR/AcrR family transcriptional regulator n=1 Tax=Paenibacillus silviterrae TaxID=3242194 RepID=UPI0025432C86|nr:WHG domain-containing protein [Paenibacillus chinjuensis]
MARAGLDRETIIRAAARIAESEGLENVTLASIAAELKVKTPSLYNHVEGLAGVRQGLAIFGIRQLGQRLGKAAMGKAGDDAIRDVGFAYVAFVREHPSLYEATMTAPDFEDPAIMQASGEVVEILLRVLAYYQLEGEEALHIVRGLRSLTHGYASLELKQGFRMELNKDESFRKLLDLFIRGLHASLAK